MAKEKLFCLIAAQRTLHYLSRENLPAFLRLLQLFPIDIVLSCFDKRNNGRKEQGLMQYEGTGVIVPTYLVRPKLHKALHDAESRLMSTMV